MADTYKLVVTETPTSGPLDDLLGAIGTTSIECVLDHEGTYEVHVDRRTGPRDTHAHGMACNRGWVAVLVL